MTGVPPSLCGGDQEILADDDRISDTSTAEGASGTAIMKVRLDNHWAKHTHTTSYCSTFKVSSL